MTEPMASPELIGPLGFDFFASWREKAIALVWYWRTAFRNVVWARWFVFRLGWPPIRYHAYFLLDD
jgi:hypothetical protein